MIAQTTRETRGLLIALGNQIKRINPSTYKVKSQNGNGWYLVIRQEKEWKCECPDHYYRGVKCKHVWAVQF